MLQLAEPQAMDQVEPKFCPSLAVSEPFEIIDEEQKSNLIYLFTRPLPRLPEHEALVIGLQEAVEMLQ
jgi:hypothetical protein